jgi:hypothetical protein
MDEGRKKLVMFGVILGSLASATIVTVITRGSGRIGVDTIPAGQL